MNVDLGSPEVNFGKEDLDRMVNYDAGWGRSNITWDENRILGTFRINKRMYPRDTQIKYPHQMSNYLKRHTPEIRGHKNGNVSRTEPT